MAGHRQSAETRAKISAGLRAYHKAGAHKSHGKVGSSIVGAGFAAQKASHAKRRAAAARRG